MNFPVRIHLFVIQLADLKAKPVAKQANAHPMQDWSCRICHQHRAPVTLRGTGFKPDTTRTRFARKVDLCRQHDLAARWRVLNEWTRNEIEAAGCGVSGRSPPALNSILSHYKCETKRLVSHLYLSCDKTKLSANKSLPAQNR